MGQPLPNHMFPAYQLSGQHNQHHESVMLAQLRVQIEFYFSPHNLVKDQYLMSLLQSTEHIGAVPLEVIANFPKVRELHALAFIGPNVPLSLAPPANLHLLRMALQGSYIVTVSSDGRWISPKSVPTVSQSSEAPFEGDLTKQDPEASATVATTSTTSTPSSPSSQTTTTSSLGVPTFPLPLKERTTVIVRDVPDDATSEQITEVFSSDLVVPKSVRPDIGNTWYVTFDSEALAVAALSASRDKTIAGAPIRGRLKSELSLPNSACGTPVSSSAARPARALAPPALQMPLPQDNKLGLPSLHPQQSHPHYFSQLRPQPFHYQHGPPLHHHNHNSFSYLPYPPYVMDPMSSFHHHHHHMAMGFQHQSHPNMHGAPRPVGNSQQKHQQNGSQEQPIQSRREGLSSPPPHVYVRPQQQNAQQQNAQKKGKKQQKNKNKAKQEEHDKQIKNGFDTVVRSSINTNRPAPDSESAERDRSNKDKDNNNEDKTNSLTHTGSSGAVPNNKKNGKSKSKKSKRAAAAAVEKTREILTEENFPALGGGRKVSASNQQNASLCNKPRAAYAEALLSQPKPATPSRSENTRTTALENAMDKMAFPSTEPTTCESYDEW